MSEIESSTKNVASIAARKWHQITSTRLKVEGLVESWNEHVQAEAAEMVRQTTEAARTVVTKNFKDWRRVVWAENEALLVPHVERTEVGTLRLKNPPKGGGNPPKNGAPAPAKPTVAVEGKKLSRTEQAILLASNKPVAAVQAVLQDMDIDDDEARKFKKDAEEAEANEKRLQEFVLWACQRADSEVLTLREKTGEELWTNAVTVEQYPNYPLLRVIFVRSSTAPLFKTHGPTVKHDFRANGKPVTINHEQMFRQLDNQRLIRSKVVSGRSHEYYVKALQYQEGMYFKGYFVVDGEEKQDLARYYVCQAGKVVTIDEAEYRRLENEAAARRPR